MTQEIKYLPKDIVNPFEMSKTLLPPYNDIPDEFKRWPPNTKWGKLFNDMFYFGVSGLQLEPKSGIDADKAFTHIRVAMSGWDSKHEHKEAGCAYLFSLWFKDAKWEVNKQAGKF